MHLAALTLHDFRNYDHLQIRFSPGLNIIHGDNAQGKTNLLESVYFLATGRSHRTSQDKDLVRQGAPALHLKAQVQRQTGDLDLELSYALEGRKNLKINGIPERKIAKLVGRLAVVLFSPDDLQLVKGPPAGRRRFLDIELSQVSSNYLYNLQLYNRVMQQRNTVLRHALETGQPLDMLAVYDEQFLDAGAQIVSRRLEAIQRLTQLAAQYHHTLSDGREGLSLRYDSAVWRPGDSADLQSVHERLAAELKRVRRDEMRRGQTMAGPHRDDVAFVIDGQDARLYASQGQQRTAVLALKFAELDFMREQIGEFPVLLLDDVASELDPTRRHFLINSVQTGVQTFVSCTDLEDLTARTWPEEHRLFRVRRGTVELQDRGM